MTMVCAQVLGNQTAISVAGAQGHFEVCFFGTTDTLAQCL